MKIFKILLVSALGLSGYLGYNNYQDFNLKKMTVMLRPMESVSPSIEDAGAAAKSRARSPEKKEEVDYSDIIIRIGESLLPLIAPILALRKKKQPDGTVRTIDDSIGNIAENMGVSRAFIRGRLGLGDRRKANVGKRKRRSTDKRT